MVVLEGSNMLTSAGNQYIQPDYLSPLPTTLDAKKSPLALLAQTCSQIGADTPPSKLPITPLDKSRKTSNDLGKSKNEKNLLHSENKLAYKPYENDVIIKRIEEIPSSKCNIQPIDETKNELQNTARKSASPSITYSSTPNSETCKSTLREKSMTPSANTSPVIQMEVETIQGHSKDLGTYKARCSGLSGNLNPACCLQDVEHSNPAFRPAFSGAPFNNQQQPGLFSNGYTNLSLGTYISYSRVKTPSGEETLMPICKDPYCTGCHFNIQNQQLLSAVSGSCSGCNQCDHQKYSLAMAMSLVPPPPVTTAALTYPQIGRPYICNWIASDTYCGKRFTSSDELLQHLRTHTNGSDSVVTSLTSSLLNSHSPYSSTTLNRSGFSNSALSPLSRYHPYSKPTLPVPVPVPYSTFNPTTLGPYYSVYSVYGRIGSAIVHP